jgi:hypothetical protein
VYARVATFEGKPDQVEKGIAASRDLLESSLDSPPDGLEGVKGLWMLVDRSTGKGLGITLFDSERDLERGDAALSAMSPPAVGSAKRTGVDFYEVAYQSHV